MSRTLFGSVRDDNKFIHSLNVLPYISPLPLLARLRAEGRVGGHRLGDCRLGGGEVTARGNMKTSAFLIFLRTYRRICSPTDPPFAQIYNRISHPVCTHYTLAVNEFRLASSLRTVRSHGACSSCEEGHSSHRRSWLKTWGAQGQRVVLAYFSNRPWRHYFNFVLCHHFQFCAVSPISILCFFKVS